MEAKQKLTALMPQHYEMAQALIPSRFVQLRIELITDRKSTF